MSMKEEKWPLCNPHKQYLFKTLEIKEPQGEETEPKEKIETDKLQSVQLPRGRRYFTPRGEMKEWGFISFIYGLGQG